jgi:hypothetical protein
VTISSPDFPPGYSLDPKGLGAPLEAKLPDGITYQSVDVPKGKMSDTLSKKTGEKIGTYFTGRLVFYFTESSDLYQLIVDYSSFKTASLAPEMILLQKNGRMIHGSYQDWFSLSDKKVIASTLQGAVGFNIRKLIPDFHELVALKGGFDALCAQRPEQLNLLGPESIFVLEDYQRFSAARSSDCPYVKESLSNGKTTQQLVETVGLEGLKQLLKSDLKSPPELARKVADITKGQSPERHVQRAVEQIKAAQELSDLVVLSVGCFDVGKLSAYLLSIGASRDRLSVLTREDWLQVINHPGQKLKKDLRILATGQPWFPTTRHFPTCEILEKIELCPLAERSKIAFMVHCSKEEYLVSILKQGYLAQAGEAAGHFPTRGADAHGYGVYTWVHNIDHLRKSQDQATPFNTGYGPICFVISPAVLDRRSGYRHGLAQSTRHPSIDNPNYVITKASSASGSIYHAKPEDFRKGAVANQDAYGVFRDKIPLKYIEEIWVSGHDVDRYRKLLRDNSLSQYEGMIKEMPQKPPTRKFKKGCTVLED